MANPHPHSYLAKARELLVRGAGAVMNPPGVSNELLNLLDQITECRHPWTTLMGSLDPNNRFVNRCVVCGVRTP